MPKTPTFLPDERGKLAQLWVTTVAGTALVIVIQSFGADWPALKAAVPALDWNFLFDRGIRYALALWFGIYMVLAYLANEARPTWTHLGLTFDVLQSIFVFVALGLLGFVTQNFVPLSRDFGWPLTAAFGTICFIATWTLAMHWRKPTSETKWSNFQRPLQLVRGSVAAVSAAAIVCVWRFAPDASMPDDRAGLASAFVFALACLLGLYFYAVFAFQKDSLRHDATAVNEVNLQKAFEELRKAGTALNSAAESLKSLQVKPAGDG